MSTIMEKYVTPLVVIFMDIKSRFQMQRCCCCEAMNDKLDQSFVEHCKNAAIAEYKLVRGDN